MEQEILTPVTLPDQQTVHVGAPRSLIGKIRYGIDHVRGVSRLAMVRLTQRSACRAASRLADTLEQSVFPVMREHQGYQLQVDIPKSPTADLTCQIVGEERALPGTAVLGEKLRALGIQRMMLDTRLEDNQIVEACEMLYVVRRHLHRANPSPEMTEPYHGWDPVRIAQALRSPGGAHLRCQTMRLTDDGTYRVDYTYCDLFFTSLLYRLIARRRRHSDHRTIFAWSPWAAAFLGVVVVVPIVFVGWAPLVARILIGVGALASALGAGVTLYTLASVQYARENYDNLSRDLMAQIAGLSRFPEVNPDIVARIEADGSVSYLNPAGRDVLHRIGSGDEKPNRVLPPQYRELVAEALRTGAPQSVEHYLTDVSLTVMYRFSPFADAKAVIVVASDVTELRALAQELEFRVEQRTEELRLTRDATIQALAGLAENRDPETGRHLERTSWYIRRLADHLRAHPQVYPAYAAYLTDDRVELLVKSAPLHDIGKVGVPDRILLKPGPLTDAEFQEMKRHTRYGGDALLRARERLGATSFLAMGEEIAFYHHERWDGAGYPEGLQGEAIPIPARLMAIADVYDALSSKRVYKEAFSHERAVEIILNERGTQFDAVLVDAFRQVEQEFRRVQEELRD